jgi:mRNA interferase MazF
VICDAFDVVIVPFPFTDLPISRKRPAVVLTAQHPYGEATGQCVIAMVTVAARSAWPFDRPITDTAVAGLNRPCVIRMKLFTIDQRLILAKTGELGERDRTTVRTTLQQLFQGIPS